MPWEEIIHWMETQLKPLSQMDFTVVRNHA
jgi:hypothetical protein